MSFLAGAVHYDKGYGSSGPFLGFGGLPQEYLLAGKLIQYLCKVEGYLDPDHNQTWHVRNTVKVQRGNH